MSRLPSAHSCVRSLVGVALSGLVLAGCGENKDPLDGITGIMSAGPSGGPGGNPSGNPPSDPTEGGGVTEGTTDTGSSGHGDCDQYLACIGAVSPGSLAEAEMTIGPNGTCWATPEMTQTCLEQCTQGLASFGQTFPDEPACGGTSGSTTTDSTTGPVTTTWITTTFPEPSTTDPWTSTTVPDPSTTDPSTTLPDTGGFGNCGWNATGGYYACNFSGVDPNGFDPIECPYFPSAGDPCGTITDIGCCAPNGDNYWCNNSQIVIEPCG